MKKLAALCKVIGIKPEERNILIGFHTVRIAWLFTTIMLLIWSGQGLIATGNLPPQGLLFFASQTAFWLAHFYYKKKFGG